MEYGRDQDQERIFECDLSTSEVILQFISVKDFPIGAVSVDL